MENCNTVLEEKSTPHVFRSR